MNWRKPLRKALQWSFGYWEAPASDGNRRPSKVESDTPPIVSKKDRKLIFAFGFDKLGFPGSSPDRESDEFILRFVPYASKASLDEPDGMIIPGGIFEQLEETTNYLNERRIIFHSATNIVVGVRATFSEQPRIGNLPTRCNLWMFGQLLKSGESLLSGRRAHRSSAPGLGLQKSLLLGSGVHM